MHIHVHTAIFKMDNQQGPTYHTAHRTQMLYGSLDRRAEWIQPIEEGGGA